MAFPNEEDPVAGGSEAGDDVRGIADRDRETAEVLESSAVQGSLIAGGPAALLLAVPLAWVLAWVAKRVRAARRG